jgi:hypothetical protein
MTTAVYAYLAGSIDSDGFISIARKTRRVGSKYAHAPTYYSVTMGFTSTDPMVPDLFHKTFGGSRYQHDPKNPKHKRWHQWQASGKVAGIAMRKILRHLRLKRPQAEFALQFLALVDSQRNRWMGKVIGPELEAPRRVLWESVTRLNSPRNRRVHFATTTD